jgi:small subunit ribosomal protein S9
VTEHPEDEQERDEQELEAAQEHVADEPAAEQPGAAEPNTEETPEAPAAAAPPEEAPEAPAIAAPPEEAPAPEAAAAPPEEAPAAQAPAEQAPAESAEEASALEEDEELEEPAPRQRPEIPGADLVPDIVPEGEEFLDAEARAAAEAEAEAAAARERDQEPEEEARPIADAAIDLAAGARYTATGKRKTAVARVILKPGAGTYLINGKQLDQFFPRETLQRIIRQPLETVGYESRMDVVARMHGGGVAAQAGALRHGISRALLVADPNLRSELKRRGFLTRDPRVKERKKAGLKKARKRPQFSKR